jgi:hypothetical protein
MPVVIASLTQWYRVVVNSCRQMVFVMKDLVGLLMTDMAHVSIPLKDIHRLYRHVEVPAICPATPPVTPVHSPL